MGSEWNPLEIMRVLLVVGQLLLISSSLSSSQTVSPNCQETCGDVAVPYPFGIGDGCYLNEYFSIHCNVTAASTPKPYLWNSTTNIEVLDISLDGELRIYTFIGTDCYNETGVQQEPRIEAYGVLPAFPFSNTKNKFTAIGCDTVAVIAGSNGNGFSSGCLSVCTGIDDVTDGACDGIGCCQTTIPEMLLNYNASVVSLKNHTNVWSFNPCSYAFLVEDKSFNFSREDLSGMKNTVVPSVLDWAVWNETCGEAAKQRRTRRALLVRRTASALIFPMCPVTDVIALLGMGNPYLGCILMNVMIQRNTRVTEFAITLRELYMLMPKGYHGDGKMGEDGSRCIANLKSSHLVTILVGKFI
ncbi:wall-associated receptor kinase 2 [Eucalyptus grandis]|uniref:wall-associated receptor kinase 2 n=1 Tax=Eucalyptus grandis TaxID=71139 RepID=UPI00192EB8D8|nr:wall-associated receptor kinase 2 [Eucalyptus grandis]